MRSGPVAALALLTLAGCLSGRVEQLKEELSATQTRKLCAMLQLYALDQRQYPTQEQGLRALVETPIRTPAPASHPQQGYVRSTDLLDPWGQAYGYEVAQDGSRSILSQHPPRVTRCP